MKMDMMSGIKPKESDSYDGAVTQEDLDCMLDHLIAAEKVKSDPALYARVKDYAASKNKMIDSMLENESVDYEEKEEKSEEAPKKKKPESFAELKKIQKEKQMEESD